MNALGLALALVLAQSDNDLLELMGGGAATDEATLQKMVAEALPKVAKVMGASPKKIPVKVISREEAGKKLQEVLKREYPGDRLERLGQSLKLIHLVEPGLDIAKEAREAYAKNVSGFYDPHDHVLYLLKDQPAMVQGMIIPHELAHAFQDEKMGLDKITHDRMDSEDAQMAMAAAVEGNAQAVATEVMTMGLVGDESGIKELLADTAAESANLAMGQGGVTPWLALQIAFPYSAGGTLVKAMATKADPTSLSLLRRLPASTAQVMSADLYRKDERPVAGSIGLTALLEGSTPIYETVVGRANLELLGNGLGDGWRGDRLEAVKVGAVACAAWVVRFAKPIQAERFAIAYSPHTGAAAKMRGKNADKTISSVTYQDATVVILEHVPEGRAEAIEAAARAALR